MHLETGIEQVWRCTSRPRSNELSDALGSYDRSRLEEYLEAVDLEVIDLKTVNLEAVNLKAVNVEAVNVEAVNLEAVDREACEMEAET